MKNRIYFLVAVLVFILAIGATSYMNRQLDLMRLNEHSLAIPGIESPDPSSDENRPDAPDFTLESEQGATVSLSNFSGNPLVLYFWNPKNETSLLTLDALEKALNQYGEGVGFLMVASVEEKSQKEDVLSSIESYHYTLPFAFDMGGKVFETYGVTPENVPAFVIIDDLGKVAATYTGEITSEKITNVVDTLIIDNFFGNFSLFS